MMLFSLYLLSQTSLFVDSQLTGVLGKYVLLAPLVLLVISVHMSLTDKYVRHFMFGMLS